MDMLFSFVLQVAKKDGIFYSPTKYVVFSFFKFHVIICFCKYVLRIGFFGNVLNCRPIQKPFIWVLVKILIIFWLWSGCFLGQSRRVFLYIKDEFVFFGFFFAISFQFNVDYMKHHPTCFCFISTMFLVFKLETINLICLFSLLFLPWYQLFILLIDFLFCSNYVVCTLTISFCNI